MPLRSGQPPKPCRRLHPPAAQEQNHRSDSEVPSWADSAKQLEDFFEKIIQGDTTSTGLQPIAEIPR